MPGLIITVSAIAMCSHGAPIKFMPNSSVTVGGSPAAQFVPTLLVTGCPNPPISGGPDIAIALLPSSFTTKVLSHGQPLLLQTVSGPGNSGVPMQPVSSAGQTKVTAT